MRINKHLVGRLLIALGLILGTANGFSQQLPDSGFEDWSGAAFDDKVQNKYWHASNVTQFGFKFNFAHREAGHTGTYCAMVQDQEVGAAGITEVSPGYMSLGTGWAYVPSIANIGGATAGTYGGYAFRYRPDSISVWIKRTGNNVSKENYNIVFYSWTGTAKGSSYKNKDGGCTDPGSPYNTDEESDIRVALNKNECVIATQGNQIAEAWLYEKKEYANWTKITIPIYYLSDDVPEKCNLIFSASNYPNFRANNGLYAGNSLYVDDLEMIYSDKIDHIYIGNKEWKGFDSNSTDVQVYSLGTATSIPEVYGKRGVGSLTNNKGNTANFVGRKLSSSEMVITKNGVIDGDPMEITVHSEDGHSTRTYKIQFVTKQSNNARLANITVNGQPLSAFGQAFNAYITSYNVALPYGTTTAPVVAYEKAEDAQQVTLTQASSTNGTSTINVTAQDGTTNTYTLRFSVAALSDNTLQNILIDGEGVKNFAPTKTSYTVELPLGTTSAPTVTPVSAYGTGEQTINILSNTLDGGCQIAVTVPGNASTRTYKLTYKITPSSYTKLADLKIAGYEIPFDPEIQAGYLVTLPLGTTTLPQVTWTAGDKYQTIVGDDSAITGTDGVYKVIVTAANGDQLIYKITFSTLKSENALLKSIMLNGVAIENFEGTTFNYSIPLAIGESTIPSITWTAGDEYQTITSSVNGMTARIFVTAGDGKTSEIYTINFATTTSDNCSLQMIYIDGTPLAGFNTNTLNYNYELPIGTTTLPSVTYTQGDEYQTVKTVNLTSDCNGQYKLMVTSNSGISQTYIIEFSVITSSNTNLTMIYVNGEAIPNFTSSTLSYNVSLPKGTTNAVITYDKGDATQEVTLPNTISLNGSNTVVVKALDGSTRRYTITLSVAKSSENTLSAIFVDGKAIENFTPTATTYNYNLPSGVSSPMSISYTLADESAVASQRTSGMVTTITVTAENGDQRKYTITFVEAQKSNCATLNDIQVNGESIVGFNPETLSYTIVLPAGTTAVPTITYTKCDANQSVTELPASSLTKTYKLIAAAEDGSATNTYSIKFSVSSESSATLTSIMIGGQPLTQFAATTLEYNYELPTGTTSLPEIVCTTSNGSQPQIIPGGVNGDTRIILGSMTYILHFTVAASSNAQLANIQVGGIDIVDFAADNYSYTYGLPYETTKVPVVSALPSESGQTINVIQASSVTGMATIYVVSADHKVNNQYTIQFYLEAPGASSVSTLAGIQIGGEPIANFKARTTSYNVILPRGTEVLPEITWTLGEEHQSVVKTEGGVTGTTTLLVTAEDEESTTTYTLNFAIEKSTNAFLSEILIDSVAVDGFAENKYSYNYPLEAGTTEVPTVSWTKGDEYQTIVATEASLEDGIKITVTAEDGVTIHEYTIHFTIAQAGVSTLLDIQVNGTSLPNFETSVFDYSYTLPIGTTSYPAVTFTPNDEFQIIKTISDTQRWMETIIVKAQTGAVSTYTISLLVEQSAIATLQDIQVNGISLEDFSADAYEYVYTLALEDSVMPTISYVKGDEYQSVTMQQGGVGDTTYIYVRSQDGSAYNIYKVFVDAIHSSETSLNNIFVDGVAISGFHPSIEEYSITLPYGSTQLPAINFEKADNYQNVKIITNGVNADALVIVTAENGQNTVYTLHFKTASKEPSSSCDLNGIFLNGNLIEGFASNQYNYNVTLPKNTTACPSISVEKNAGQSVMIAAPQLQGKATIMVIAEDGVTKAVYSISFNHEVVGKSNNSKLNSISIGGVAIENFVATTTEYSYSLNLSATSHPAVTYEKSESSQTVYVTPCVGAGDYFINVIAEDGTNTIYTIHFVAVASDNTSASPSIASITPPEINISAVDGQTITAVIHNEYGNADITVIAENGDTATYAVPFNTKTLSNNTNIEGIIIDNTRLDVFAKSTKSYNVLLPASSTTIPTVSAITEDPNQTIAITNGDTTTIHITAEDNITTDTYTIIFSHDTLSSDASLSFIMFGSELLSPLEEQTVSLTNASACPAILPYPTNSKATIKAINIPSIPGVATIEVWAEDGVTSKTYSLNITTDINTDATLTNLYVNGTLVPSWNPSKNNYSVSLASDQTPVVTYLAKENQSIMQTTTSEQSTILVVAQDGSTMTYTINYSYQPNTSAALADIKLYVGSSFISLPDFDKNTFEYTYSLPLNTKVVPSIYPIAGAHGQTIEVTYGNTDTITIIKVTAEDGEAIANYKIAFPVAKHSNALLENVDIPDAIDYTFSKNVFEYTVTLPFGTTAAPMLSWEIAEGEGQIVTYTSNPFSSPSTLVVTAEDGTTAIYTFNFILAENTADNVLQSMIVDGIGSITLGDISNVDISLPYGTTSISITGYVKNFHEQNVVFIDNGIAKPSSLIVSASGKEDKVYTINPIVESNPASLTDIKVNGTSIPNFSIDKHLYIVNVSNAPTSVEATAVASTSSIDKVINNHKHVQFFIENEEYSDTYDVYFFYTNDIIPNMSFEDFESVTNTLKGGSLIISFNDETRTGVKPIGWHAPISADISENKGTYYPENAIKEETSVVSNGSKSVSLNTTYLTTSAESMPGLISLSQQIVGVGYWALGIATTSTTLAFGDAMTYRNTPDTVLLDYNPKSNSNVTGWRFVYKANGDATVYSGSYSTKNTWQTMVQPLTYDADFVPVNMDIIINSANSENPHDFYTNFGTTRATSTLYVDNLRIRYNSQLTSLMVNGVDAVLSGTTFSATINAESYGQPELTITGQVPDQHRDITWNSDYSRASIRNYAEDGSYTDYTLLITRPVSSNNAISRLIIGSDTITPSETISYERTSVINPDIAFVPASAHASASVSQTANQTIITITSESGDARSYTISYINAVNDNTDIELSADGFTKTDDNQTVIFTRSDTLVTAHVIASNGTSTKDYSLPIGASANITSYLSDLLIDGETPTSFVKTNYQYEVSSSAVSFVRESVKAKVEEIFTQDSITIKVIGNEDSHTYVLSFTSDVAENNADLLAINLNDALIDGYNRAVYEYTLFEDTIAIDVIPADNRQIITMNYYSGKVNAQGEASVSSRTGDVETYATLIVNVLAADGATTNDYLIYFNKTLSDNTILSAIMLNGELINLSGTGYTSDYAFAADQTIYNITLNSADPKLVQPSMPTIGAIGSALTQSVAITNLGLGETSSVVVTAEDGTTAEYYLKVNAQKSAYATLKGLYINGISVPNWNADSLNYEVELSSLDTLHVAYVVYDKFQTITPYISNDKVEIVVQAENGAENTYTVNLSVAAEYSDASLKNIKLDNTGLTDFDAATYDYNITLPAGTTTLPIIKAYRNVDGQEVKITTAGVNGTTEIIVTALDGVTSNTYNIEFVVEPFTDNDLSLISIDYSPIANYVPSTHNYNVALDVVPTDIMVTFAHADQALIGTPEIDTDEQSIMIMYQSNGVTQQPYIIDYTLNSTSLSTDADIDGIYLDGTMLPGFASTSYTYSYEFPTSTTILPQITIDLRDGQSVEITTNGVSGQTMITVTAEDGVTRKYYTIDFSVAPSPLSSNALLSMIYVDGEPIVDFVPETLVYTITLPATSTIVPAICWLKGEEHQSIAYNDSAKSILVTAEDGVTTALYQLSFVVAKSNNAQLRNILVNGMTLSVDGEGYQSTDNFDASVTYYELVWGNGTTATSAQINPVKDEEKQIVTISPDELTINGGKTTITVTAEDGVTTTTYTLRSNLAQSACDTLKMLYVDGTPIAFFNAHTYEYQLSLEAGSSFQLIDYIAGDAYQTISETIIPLSEFSQKTTISVVAQTGAEKIYSVTQTIAKFAIDTLAAIYVDPTGNGLQNILVKNGEGYTADYDFSGTRTIYNITWGNCLEVPADINKVITLDYDTAVLKQTVTINQPLISHDGTMILTVTAQNGSSRMYIINCKRSYSSDNTIASVLMDDEDYASFNSEVTNYTEILPIGSPEGIFPNIDFILSSPCASADTVWTKSDYSATCDITVTAEDGKQKTYKFAFTIERSSEVLLSSLTINGLPIFTNGVGYTSDNGWDANIDEYNILWNVGTTALPEIGYIKGDEYQTVTITPDPINTLEGDIVITVTAGDGVTTMTYTLHNSLAHYSDNTLKMIYYGVPYVEVPEFNPDSTSYSISLEHGTTSFPAVNFVKNSAEWQTVSMTWDTIDNRNAVCYLTVQPEDTTVAPLVYTVRFNILCSTSTDLIDIFVNGKSMAITGDHYTASNAYANDINEYTVTWEVGTTTVPTYMAIEGDDYQTIDITQPASLTSDALISVMAEDSTMRTITIHNVLLLSSNNTLSSIELDGREIEGFMSNNFAYTVILEPGVRSYPKVTYEQGDQWQTVSATTLPNFVAGDTVSMSITVMAQDSTTNVYTISFISLLSEVATLNGIFVNDNLINNFEKDTFNYAIAWPIGSTELPTITYEKGDSFQTVVVSPAALSALDGKITFEVTAEDGIHKNTYTLTSTLLHSYNDSLTNIYYGGENIAAFHPDTLVYNIELKVGTRVFPMITFDNGDKYQTVEGPTELSKSDYAASYALKVTAEAGNTRTYIINFTILKSANADLEMIYLDNKELPEFNSALHEYNVVLPTGTTSLPAITWISGDEFQKVDTLSAGVNGDYIFIVTAEDGTEAKYTLHFSVALSNESRLDNIACDDIDVSGFDEDITEYNIVLPYGTTVLPTVTYTKKEETQAVLVNVLENSITLVVTAEDGVSVTTYTLNFSVARSSNAFLLDIAANGTTIEDFHSENFEYAITLPYGTATLPEITFTKADDQQSVEVVITDNIVTLIVTSGDGENTNEYVLTFTNALCPINWLNDLMVSGTTIDGFHSDSLVYNVSYPAGTHVSDFFTAEDITYTKADSTETVVVAQQDEATILITVTAENGDVRVYVIIQSIRLSDNSLLADIIIDGVSLKNFESLTFDYTYYLYEGAPVPSVDAIPQDTLAEVAITVNNVGEVTYIYCTAEDGSESIYTILFAITDMDVTGEAHYGQTKWVHIPGTNQYKAISIRENVQCALYDATGRLISMQAVTPVDPNKVVTVFDKNGQIEYIFSLDDDANGTIFTIPEMSRTYIYIFYYDNKTRLDHGKFILVP